MFQYTMLAPDLAEHRTRELERSLQNQRLVALARADRPARGSIVRRPAAQVVALFSLASAAVVRHLDECVADDLGRSLAPTE
jgi:hypothetical protein